MDTMDKSAVTNQRVADDLGVSHATISRIRSGDRTPSVGLIVVIEKKFGWKLDRQVKAKLDGSYADKFEELLVIRYNPALVTGPVATSGIVA